jgi:type III secretory pathway component EscT
MKVAAHPVNASSEEDLAWRVFGAFLLVVFVSAGGLKALFLKFFAEHEHAPAKNRSWFAEARSQASIATSYAHMATTMLQSSRRDNRQERRSRP